MRFIRRFFANEEPEALALLIGFAVGVLVGSVIR